MPSFRDEGAVQLFNARARSEQSAEEHSKPEPSVEESWEMSLEPQGSLGAGRLFSIG